jgi:hypothetical protein
MFSNPKENFVLSGIDEKAGGTWFGITRSGKIALLYVWCCILFIFKLWTLGTEQISLNLLELSILLEALSFHRF